MRGTVIDVGSQQDAPVGELIGIAIAIILLTFLFRSLAAMAATLVGALIGVMVGQILLVALAAPLGLPEFALGDRGDARPRRGHRLLAADHRPLPGAARGRRLGRDAVGEVGAPPRAPSVVAAGLIVMVAIAGLLVIGIPFIGKMGIGGGDRRRRRRRLRADDPADHDRRLRELAGARRSSSTCSRRRPSAAGARSGHGAAVALDRRRRADPARLRLPDDPPAARPARRRQPAGVQDPARRLRPR